MIDALLLQPLPLLSLRYLLLLYGITNLVFIRDGPHVYMLGFESHWRDGELMENWHFFCTITSRLGC